MKLLLVLMVYDYGVKERGYSYEYLNIKEPLSDIVGADNLVIFDFYSEFKQHGKQAMNKKLFELVKAEKPDGALFCLFENEFDEAVLQDIRKLTRTAVYFFDDPWRVQYVKHWRDYFDFYSTPDYYMYQQYLQEGIRHAVYCPFGFNDKIYSRKDLPKKYDVSFVGGYNPYREWVVKYLKKSGIDIHVFGRGWGNANPWLSQDDMVDVFNQSKINLNLSNGVSYDISYLLMSVRKPKSLKQLLLNRKNREQVKGRTYEINACGGFQLTYFIPGLNRVYELDKEIAAFEDVRRLPQIIDFFLKADTLREEIASAGYKRSVKDHSAQGYLKNYLDIIINPDARRNA